MYVVISLNSLPILKQLLLTISTIGPFFRLLVEKKLGRPVHKIETYKRLVHLPSDNIMWLPNRFEK